MPALPSGTTDTHLHVFDPRRFGYVADRSYTPGEATVDALLQRNGRLGVQRVVLVQPSVYGTDNGCLLDAIARLGVARARGIAVVDLEQATRHDLLKLHDRGVRGIRLNMEVRQEHDRGRARAQLLQAAALVDLPGWNVQLHCAATLLPVLAEALPAFKVPVVLDHFAGLTAAHTAPAVPALSTLLVLLQTGSVHVKLSAFYKASSDAPHHADLTALARTLMRARTDRLLWGSDWPHTGGGNGPRDPARIEPFRSVDLAASLRSLADWADDDTLLHRILVDNPAALYGFEPA
jgi:predicted TIM-barrel fold metal-dependent hydrolase